MSSNHFQQPEQRPTGRNPLLLFLGFLLLGIALAYILFGGDFFSRGGTATGAETDTAGEIPELSSFGEPEVIVAELPDPALSSPQVGAVAPDFATTNLEGEIVSLADFRGRPVIINFWATWCAPCRIEMPELQTVYQEYQDEELVILAINREEDAERISDFFYDEMELTFTPLLDEDALVANLFNVFNMPTTYFVDAEGIITAVHRGAMSRAQIEGYLENTISSSG